MYGDRRNQKIRTGYCDEMSHAFEPWICYQVFADANIQGRVGVYSGTSKDVSQPRIGKPAKLYSLRSWAARLVRAKDAGLRFEEIRCAECCTDGKKEVV